MSKEHQHPVDFTKMDKEQFKKCVGKNIKYIRLAYKMSTHELADILELTPGFVGLIERGTRGASSYNILKLAEAFDIPTDTFFRGPEDLCSDPDNKNALIRKLTTIAKGLPEDRLEYAIDMIKGLSKIE